jgi:hypothetical protein
MLFLVCRNMLSHNGLRLHVKFSQALREASVKVENHCNSRVGASFGHTRTARVTLAKNFKFVPPRDHRTAST